MSLVDYFTQTSNFLPKRRCGMKTASVDYVQTEQNFSDICDNLLAEEVDSNVRQLWNKIKSFDLSRERAYLSIAYGHSGEYAVAMELEYRKFLFLRAMHPEMNLPMSVEVDDFWHVHVLNTRNYQRFVDECAGGNFVHHRPNISNAENRALVPAYINGTITMYRKYFGEPPQVFWETDPKSDCCICICACPG